jgi:hypothetical protein
MHRIAMTGLVAAVAALATGCGSSAAGETGPRDGGQDSSANASEDASVREGTEGCVDALVQGLEPTLNECRTCHVPGGLAAGTRVLLSANPSEDETNLFASWQRVGALLLSIPSLADAGTHPGGDLLPAGGVAYQQMSALLTAFANPLACEGAGDASGAAAWPLLGSARGGHLWSTFCADLPDGTPLPVDPRTLVEPGVNAGKAAYFNAFWVDCHVAADGGDAGSDEAPPKTCGEYRALLAQGTDIMVNGNMWFFGGNSTDSLMAFSADDYNKLWIAWGYASRPPDFDQLVASRWGVPIGTARNPYPLPGEDPNATNGGSGQLPVALTQLHDAKGYSGKIGMNCNWCHSARIGDPSDGPGLGTVYGTGNSLGDIGALFGDVGGAGFPIAANKVRGTGDILLYPAIAAMDVDKANRYNGSLVAAPSGGSVDFPVWWNVGHRTRRFYDGSFAMDDARPVMGFAMPIFRASHLLDIVGGRAWISSRDEAVRLWLESLTSPRFPGPVDTRLAEEGAILFHNKNMWAPELHNPVPPPAGGNGSCATCHGVYSPRYVHDAAYLDTPALEGIAAHIVPLATIGTDSARYDSLNAGLQENLSWTWWAYGTNDAQGRCFGVEKPGGYLAPPLYGVWATAPYFHNGSVPNVWEVLKPADRKPIWRRVSAPAPVGDPNAFTGFDTDLSRAYDTQKLGWRYDELACAEAGGDPALTCTPGAAETSAAGSLWFTWNLQAPPLTRGQLEDRKVYNTHQYSQGNQGHEFTAVLTDEERAALVEYLKTL